ncbi:MAG: glycosyltransferase [bacterium]
MLTPLVPAPPHDGDKLRLYHLLKELKKRGHRIDLFCLTRVKKDLAQIESLRPFCRQIYAEHLGNRDLFLNLLGGTLMGRSLNLSSHFSPRLREALRAYWKSAAGKSVDAVLAHRLRMAPMAFEANPGVPVLLELTDCLGAYLEQVKKLSGARWIPKLLAYWDQGLVADEEAEWGNRAAATIVISDRDAKALALGGVSAEKIKVVPNGIDLVSRQPRPQRPDAYPPDREVVCFTGNMGYFPNEDGALWFHREIWPRVRQAVPSALLALVGGTPGSRLKRLEKPGEVLVTGWVPEMEPYIVHSQLTIAPLRVAAGMQNKVALSLRWGVPVAASPAAVGWLEAKARNFISVAEDPVSFSRAVVEILKKPIPARALARRGKNFLLKNYPWVESGRKMDELLKSLKRK